MVTRQRLTLAAIVALIVLLAWLQAGCGDNETPARAYTCTVLYRCSGQDITARVGAVCAGDLDEAADDATELGIAAAASACPTAWQYVRPLCTEQLPEAACDLTR